MYRLQSNVAQCDRHHSSIEKEQDRCITGNLCFVLSYFGCVCLQNCKPSTVTGGCKAGSPFCCSLITML